MIPETRRYRLKNKLLGPPLVSEQLSSERLGRPTALAVLSSDVISSSAYATEQALIPLVKVIGVAAFSLLVPVSVAVIVVLLFVTASYLEVVKVYTKAGGAYVVARENFGLGVAQIAAVALLIDYTVTVAVQTSAGTAALTSAAPGLLHTAVGNLTVPITIAVVLLLLYGNLRGIREAGRFFAVPTYFFIVNMASVIVVGATQGGAGPAPHHPHPPRLGDLRRQVRHAGQRLADGVGLRAAAVLRQRRFLPDRYRGHLQRGERLPPARGPQRPPDPGGHELDPGLSGPRGLPAGPLDPCRAVPDRVAHRGVPGGQGGLRDQRGGSPLLIVLQFATMFILYTGGQHQLHRLPVPGQLRGR